MFSLPQPLLDQRLPPFPAYTYFRLKEIGGQKKTSAAGVFLFFSKRICINTIDSPSEVTRRKSSIACDMLNMFSGSPTIMDVSFNTKLWILHHISYSHANLHFSFW